MDGIFISYRRDDSAGYAGRLYDRLVSHFGVDRVFMDVEGIEPGTDFVDAIERAIASCRVLIVLIGDEWLSATDTGGRRRLDDPNDFIRLETGAALERDIRVVPVLLDGALMPHESDLPDTLKSLVRRQAVELTHKQWEASSGKLIRTLERILSTDAKPAVLASPIPSAPGAPELAENANASGEAHHSKTWMIGFVMAIAIAIGVALFLRDKPKPTPEPIPVAEPTTVPVETTPPTEPQPPIADAAPEPAPRPAQLEITPSQLAFADTETGQSTSTVLRLTNTGETEAPLNTRLLGKSVGSYHITDDSCGETLAPGASCSYTIKFEPAGVGARPAELMVDFGADAPLAVALEATATAPAPVAAEAPAATVAETPPAIFQHFGGPIAPEEPATSAAESRPAPETPPPPPRPVIQTLTSESVAGGAKICYRVDHADSLVLTPQPGKIGNSLRDCVTVPLAVETTLTLIAIGPGGQASVGIDAAPAPSVTAEAPSAVADSPAPGDPADTGLPARGDTWTYRTRGKWATSPQRTIIFEVENIDSGVITERYLEIAPRDAAGPAKRSRAGDTVIVDWGAAGWEFSPWLAASDDFTGTARLRDFTAPAMDREWGDWSTAASIQGKRRITVPAGTFATMVVEASASRPATGGRAQAMVEPVRVKFTMWYSPKVKRYVKMERSVFSASRREIEQDTFELVKYNTR